jgi:hypothetical protein
MRRCGFELPFGAANGRSTRASLDFKAFNRAARVVHELRRRCDEHVSRFEELRPCADVMKQSLP